MAGKKIIGYKGKQVRDNIHLLELGCFMFQFSQTPRPGEVYNRGGGKENSCSILEALDLTKPFTGKAQKHAYVEENRCGVHIFCSSGLRKILARYPNWDITRSLEETIREIVASGRERQV